MKRPAIIVGIVLGLFIGTGGCSQDKKPPAPASAAPVEKPDEKTPTKPR